MKSGNGGNGEGEGKMIRAKMSDRGARLAEPTYYLGGIEQTAEREARVILAETEPETSCTWHCSLADPTGPFGALAESLRAFLACEQHVAMGERS